VTLGDRFVAESLTDDDYAVHLIERAGLGGGRAEALELPAMFGGLTSAAGG
jgi:hypothetical protein